MSFAMSQRADVAERTIPRPRRLGKPAARIVLARYSRFVGLMKVALPATAAALLGLIVVWPKVAPRDEAFQIAFANFNIKTVDTLSMIKPRYFGTDDKNLPFTVTADIATQVDPQSLVVALENPVADLSRKNGGGMVLNSDVGFFRQKDGTLDLMGHVDLYQDSGYELHTDSARVEVGPGNATGDEPTRGNGPSGTIEGEGFRLWERGKTILFTGRSKAVLAVSKTKAKS
jgi:lipopolysaccharide export system protein LptC